jgi:hypothetical protein
MSTLVAIMGESGHGKSTSIRTLDPKKTFIIDCDRKGLPFSGWRKNYNKENKNYLPTSDKNVIITTLKNIHSNKEYSHIKTVVIDTVNSIMVDDEMERMKEKGYDKWVDLAQDVWAIISECLGMRPDLIIVCMFHIEDLQDDNGAHVYRILTSGRKLQKIKLESRFSTVLFAKAEGGKYYLETQSRNSTAKSPDGMFKEFTIPNDLKFVVDSINKYDDFSL